MSLLIIKKEARLVFIFLITNFLVNSGYSQSDSAEIRKEITEVLKKHGYNSFQINVNSFNQTGGQTAFSITNNYQYIDPHYLPDSENFEIEYIDSNKVTVAISPKQGAWVKPFVAYPDTFLREVKGRVRILGYCDWSHYAGMSSYGGMYLTYKGFPYEASVNTLEIACTNEMPLCSSLYNGNSFFIFGDYADQSKWYAYDFGRIWWLKSDINFSPFPIRYQLKPVMTMPISR